jgi:hypothetical protein
MHHLMQKNGTFAHFCIGASVHIGAVGADGAPGKSLYKPTVTNFGIVPMHMLQILLHYQHDAARCSIKTWSTA